VLICCVDGLKGFPEAIEAVFPQAWVQTCIVHLIRQSLRFVPDKHRRQVAKDLKPIYPPSTSTQPPKRSPLSRPLGVSATR
jgi:putative transposase